MACAEGTEPEQLVLPSTAEAPGVARAYVAARAVRLPMELIDDAMLLVSELVTNAVRHGSPRITLTVRNDPAGIGVGVTDHGQTLPMLPQRQPNDPMTSGRGLLIVDALATAWGVISTDPPPGKTVWFELDPTSRP